ncbi:MAG: nucleotidyltransferase family protein [Chloroflexi bacterium]|nr:nucleotidyltransferase family protein [Chloroflexota bacterium]
MLANTKRSSTWLRTPLSPEQRFLLECVRRSCGVEARPLPAVQQWTLLIQCATTQTVLPALDAVLQDEQQVAPDDVRRLVHLGAALAVEQRLRVQDPGVRLTLQTLVDAGCDPVVLKGAALAYTRYPNPASRLFSDVDVLLPEHQIGRAATCLAQAGYTLVPGPALPAAHQHLPPLQPPDHSIAVELHRGLVEDTAPYRVEIGAMLQRARPVSILGVPVRELDPVDALIHVSVHLSYGHRYTRMPIRSLADILALTSHDRIDWPELVSRARAAHVSGAVIWPLALARGWLGAPVPHAVLAQLAPPRPLTRVLTALLRTGSILDPSLVPDDGSRVLHDTAVELSLVSGCSARTQLATLAQRLLPGPHRVTHLQPVEQTSPTAYLRAMLRPERLSRGVRAALDTVRATRERLR